MTNFERSEQHEHILRECAKCNTDKTYRDALAREADLEKERRERMTVEYAQAEV